MVDKNKYIQRFKEIHHKKTGEVISDESALEYFEQLISLVGVVYRPIPKEAIEVYGRD